MEIKDRFDVTRQNEESEKPAVSLGWLLSGHSSVVHSVSVVCWFKPDTLGSIPGDCQLFLLPHQICSLIVFPNSSNRVLVRS